MATCRTSQKCGSPSLTRVTTLRDGAVLSRVSGSDAYEAVLYWYADLVTDRPRSFSFLRDVQ